MTFWTLDKTKANKAGQSDFINGNSQLNLKILSAGWKAIDSKKGGQNLYLSLYVMNESKNTTHLDILYGNSFGECWSGENLINALMTVCNTPSLSQVHGEHTLYDFNQGQDAKVPMLVAPELAGKVFGAFLTENWYVKDGQPKKAGVNLFNVYDYQTNQLAWQKNTGQPASQDELAKVYEAMIKASEKAYEATGTALNVAYNDNSNDNSFMPVNTTYQRNPLPVNSTPAPSKPVHDDEVPF